MSDMLPPVLFTLRSNASQFLGDMKEARTSLAETGAAGDAAADQVAKASAKQQAAADRLAEANRVTADSIKASVDEQIAAEQRLAEQTDITYDAEARKAQLTAAAVKSAATEQVAATRAVADADKELAAASEASAATQVEATGAASAGFMKFGKIAAAAMVAATAVIAAESLKQATEFQTQITLLQTAGGETKKNIGIVANGIKSLAESTGTSTTQLADGMYLIEKAGVRGADGLKILKAAAEGAKAENVDLGIATTALTSIMMSYHLSASQATVAENELVKGAGMAKTTMSLYANALSTVIPIASAAKISFAQVAGAIATLTQHGTSAQEATQELASTIRNLQAPNNVAIKAMQQLGINVTDLETHLGTRGLTGTITLITNAIQNKMGPAGLVVVNAFKQSQSATADLATELSKMPPQLAALSTQFENGKLSYKEYYADVKGLGGQMYELGKGFVATMGQAKGFNSLLVAGTPAQQTAANALKQVMGGAIGLNTALMLGGANMKYFTTATNAVSAAGQKSGKDISTWAMTQKTLAVQLDKLKEIIQVLFINIGQKLIPVVTKIVGWIVKHKTVVEILVASLGSLVVVFGTLTAAVWAFNTALDANPIVLAVAALAALAAGVYEAYQHCKTFRDIVQEVWSVIKTAFRIGAEVVTTAVHVVMDVWNALWATVKAVWNTVGKPIFDIVKTTVLFLFDNIIKPGFQSMADLWNALWGAMQSVWNSVGKPVFAVIATVFRAIGDGLKWAYDHVIKPVLGVLETAWKYLYNDVIKPIADVIGAAWKAIGDGLQWAWDHVIKPILGTIESAIQGVSTALDVLTGKDKVRVGGPPIKGVVAPGAFAPGTLGGPPIATGGTEGGIGANAMTKAVPFSTSGITPAIAAGGNGGVTVNVNVAGSVLSENDLATTVQRVVLQYGTRNPNNGLSFVRG